MINFIKRIQAEKKARRQVADEWRDIIEAILTKEEDTQDDSGQEQNEASS